MFSTAIIAGGVNDLHDVSRPVRARRARGSSMSSLFGVELPTPVNFVIAFAFVLLLIGAAAWLVRRFGSTRIDAAARGRQPHRPEPDDRNFGAARFDRFHEIPPRNAGRYSAACRRDSANLVPPRRLAPLIGAGLS
jgi:hypothetical protein